MENQDILVKDHFKTNEQFQLKWYSPLACFITSPMPNPAEIHAYYESENYSSHKQASTSVKDVVYNLVRNYMLTRKIQWIKNETHARASVLDIGCGVGEFVKKANASGFQCSGVEPNSKARNIALQKNIQVVESLKEVSTSKFDVITLWHVLEHLHNPLDFLKDLQRHLNSQAKVFLALPNYNSFDAEYYKEFWAAYDVPRHLYHFSRASVEKLAFQTNFSIVSTYPLPFDSYYVSMLSEKYKTGKIRWKWLWNGYKSNQVAKRNGEWSSLVYVLQSNS